MVPKEPVLRAELCLMHDLMFIVTIEDNLATATGVSGTALDSELAEARESAMTLLDDRDGTRLVELLREIRGGQFSIAKRIYQLCDLLDEEPNDELEMYLPDYESVEMLSLLSGQPPEAADRILWSILQEPWEPLVSAED